ncbi:MAG: hypothetical protein HOW97_35025 [Catenulispora sp.]|nr:hypothetical protein [Catenulispora sp.]
MRSIQNRVREAAGAPSGRAVPRRARTVLAAVTALTAISVAACVGPPSGGDSTLKPLSQSHNNVFIAAREPSAEMDPGQLVQNFLQALTGDQKDPTFSVAQDYLSKEVRKTWIAPGTTWNARTSIVELGNPIEAQPGVAHAERGADPAGSSTSIPDGTQTTVEVTATEVAQLDDHGFYQADAQPSTSVLPFNLKYERGDGWRIEKAPTERLINLDSFKRVYQTNQSALPIYLPGSGGQAVDQVYLTQATGKPDYTYNALAEAVLNGRDTAQASPLQMDKSKPVTLNAQGVATVTLRLPSGGGTAGLEDVQTALLKTFSDAASAPQMVGSTPQLQKVLVTYDGCGTACVAQDVSTASTDQPPLVYWLCPVVNGRSTVVSRAPTAPSSSASVCGDNTHVVMTLNDTVAKDSPLAVAQPGDASRYRPQTSQIVAVVVKRPDGTGAVMVTDRSKPDQHEVWYTLPDPAAVTDLEWDPVDGFLWMVQSHGLYRLRDPAGKPPGTANVDPVTVPSGAQLTGFKPSPDGTRAVLVTDQLLAQSGASTPWPAAMVAIDRGTDAPRQGSADAPRLVGVDTPLLSGPGLPAVLSRATDAAWADARTVVLIGNSGTSNTLRVFKVYSDGSQDSLISDPEDAQPAAKHISAASSVLLGRPGIWVFSDGAGPAGSATGDTSGSPGSNVYFKRRGGGESYQDNGWSPVVATAVPDDSQ